MRSGITILTLFGTRPEVIKLAPVIQELSALPSFRVVNVFSRQHTELASPFIELFDIPVHYDLAVMRDGQTPSGVCARVMEALDPVLAREQPQMILVQGDTTTVLAGALAAFHRKIPVGHVEAGMRSGDVFNPFPEEMNRRLATQMSSFHFAATDRNRRTLLREGVADEKIYVTGNPVVQALHWLAERSQPSAATVKLIERTHGTKRVLLTTHRRESFGEKMEQNLRVLRAFIERHEDTSLIFPVHLNPNVQSPAAEILGGHPRIHLIAPAGYADFITLISQAWLVVSDSGGVQEEAPTLGKAVLVLRENTERPEGIEAGVAKLVGARPERLNELLEEARHENSWIHRVRSMANPFGTRESGKRIAEAVVHILKGERPTWHRPVQPSRKRPLPAGRASRRTATRTGSRSSR